MDKSCSKSQCKRPVAFSCMCVENFFSCTRHIGDHLIQKANHSLKQLVIQADFESKQKIIKRFKILDSFYKSAIKKTRSFVDDLINKVIKESKKLLNKLEHEKKMIKLMCSNVMRDMPVDIDLLNKFNEDFEDDFKDFELRSNEFDKVTENLFNYDYKYKGPYFETNFMFYFINSQVRVIDLETLKHVPPFFSISSNICYGSATQIENGKFFAHGSYYDEKERSRIIDFNKKVVENLPNGDAIGMSGMCYSDNNIYSFGGWLVANTRKFSLKDKVWSQLTPLPEAIGRVSTSLHQNHIYVLGFQSQYLFKYSIKGNSFQNSVSLAQQQYKYIFAKFIVIFSDYLYYTKDFINVEKVQRINQAGTNLKIYSSFRKGKYIYFVLCAETIFRIDTKSKCLEEIRIQ